MTKWRTRYVNNMIPCKDCEYLMLCGGGCARYEPDEKLFTGMCENFQEIFNLAAPLAITKFLNEPKSDTDKDNSEKLPNSEYINNPRCLSLSTREILARINPDERKQILATISPLEVIKILADKLHE